jgi:hypothetical protein
MGIGEDGGDETGWQGLETGEMEDGTRESEGFGEGDREGRGAGSKGGPGR